MITNEKDIQIKNLLHDFKPEVWVASPGRINLIGEHTDYNNGFVMPAAIDRKIYFKFRKNGSESTCKVYSETFDAYFEFDLQNIIKSSSSWENYILGVVVEIQKKDKKLEGFDVILKSELPIGAGISSSAALECGIAGGLNKLFSLDLTKMEIVHLSQKAENNFVGNNCGIMDQFASVMSKKDHFIMLDCQNLDASFIPSDLKNFKLLLVNTKVSHNLAESEYNTRRNECEESVKIIQQKYPQIVSSRDLSLEILTEFKDKLPATNYKRCLYVLEENNRVEKAAKTLKNADLKGLGELMFASHRGLQHLYEVSCKELDFLVDYAENKDYIYGSRMMGGGFGGCTINLIKAEKIEEYTSEIKNAYQQEFNIEPDIISVLPTEGSIIETV